MPTNNHHHKPQILVAMANEEEEEEDQQDFSFPTTTDTPPRFIESPPLWRPSKYSLSSPPKIPERNQEHEADQYYCKWNASRNKASNSMPRRKSFSYIERGTKMNIRRIGVSDDGDEEQEEKMDMLWEDFNEEFSTRNSKATTMTDSDHMSPGRMLSFGCVQALKLSKANKKPSIVVFMKVLKKMFLNHQNPHRPVRKNDRC